MPIYDYECPGCGKQSEDLAPIAGPDPVCDCGQPLRRLISVPGMMKVAPHTGPIYDFHRQVEAQDPHWRSRGTTGREGGAGAHGRVYLDPRSSRSAG